MTKITVPSSLLDASLRHQVYLGRYSNAIVQDTIGLLNAMDKDLIDLIKKKGDVKNFTSERLNALLQETGKLITSATETVAQSTAEQLTEFAAHEAKWSGDVLGKIVAGKLDIVTPTAEHLAAIVSDQPFQGALLGEWFGKLASDKQHAITQAARLGMAEGESIDQIVRRVKGTAANSYADGALEITRRNARSVVRTAVNHTSNTAQQMLLHQNSDILDGWVFVSTLDGRTTITCASLSGTKWPIGEGPIPPRHFSCRSFAMPLVKTWKQLGIDAEEIPPAQRAAIGGPVNADISFSDWLKGQKPELQDDILGSARGKLFREGGLTVDKFTDKNGHVLPLSELKQKESKAFHAVFGEKVPGSGGGHIGGAPLPIPGPMDFSNVFNKNLSPDAINEAKKAAVAAEKLAQAKASKAEYMAKYNAAKKAEKEAVKAAAEAEAKAAASAQAQWESETIATFKSALTSGDMGALTADQINFLAKLPEASKAAIQEEVKLAKAAAEAQAKKVLEAKAAFEASALQAKSANNAFGSLSAEHSHLIKTLPPEDYMSLVSKVAKQVQAQEEQAKKWGMYKPKIKKLLLDGKPLPPAFQATLDGVSAIEKEKFLAGIVKSATGYAEEQVQAKVVAASENKLLFSDMQKIENAKGSNEGGLYLNRATGEKWYIKTPASADQAINEVVANHLYEMLGIKVPQTVYIEVEGRLGIASKWIDGITKGTPATLAKAVGTMEGFAADAWLANWDVVGLSHDNLLLQGGQAIRIDAGGALLYRAQGGAKGALFGNIVTELDSLRNAANNSQSAAIFGKIKQKELEDSVRKILRFADQDIRATIDKYASQWTAAERNQVADTLIARKADLAKRFPDLLKDEIAVAPKDLNARITDHEMKLIKDSRINGYVVPTDTTLIEDQHVLVWIEKDTAGKEIVKAQFKVIDKAFEALNKEVASVSTMEAQAVSAVKGVSVTENSELSSSIVTAIKGIATQAKNGGTLREVDIQRVKDVVSRWNKLVMNASADAEYVKFMKHYEPWIDSLAKMQFAKVGDVAVWKETKIFSSYSIPVVQPVKDAVSPWLQTNHSFIKNAFTNGAATSTGESMSLSESVTRAFTRNIDGIKATYWNGEAIFSLQGTVELRAAYNGTESVESLFSAIEKMGINAARATSLDREELYLRQILYSIDPKGSKAVLKKMDKLAGQSERIKVAQDYASGIIGKDVKTLKGYQPDGIRQAFGQGRVNTMRPDLEGPLWEEFKQEFRLYHQNTGRTNMTELIDTVLNGGGQMAPTVDKLRRGVPMGGMSPVQDLSTGGANYFFTRIKQVDERAAGFFWSPDAIKRLDAISYDRDMYGRVTGNTVTSHRISDVRGWISAAGKSSNETIFKNSLSLFDGLDRIAVDSQAEVNSIIEVFKKHGYNKFPDGRLLTDVIKVR